MASMKNMPESLMQSCIKVRKCYRLSSHLTELHNLLCTVARSTQRAFQTESLGDIYPFYKSTCDMIRRILVASEYYDVIPSY